jgi:hypothetical protein
MMMIEWVGVVSLLAKRIKYYRILTASPPYLKPMATVSMLSFFGGDSVDIV